MTILLTTIYSLALLTSEHSQIIMLKTNFRFVTFLENCQLHSNYDFSIIRTLRRHLDLTLEKLAKRANLTYSTVASVETNKTFPSLKTLDAIAGVLEIAVGKLISLAEHNVVQTRQAESAPAEVLQNSKLGLKDVKVTYFDECKIFRVSAKANQVINSMVLHENCHCHGICYVLEGSVKIRVKDNYYKLNSNDATLFDGTFDHQYTAISDTEFLVICIYQEIPASLRHCLRVKDGATVEI